MRNIATNQVRKVAPSSFQEQQEELLEEDISLEKEVPASQHSDKDQVSAEI